eukprot:403337862
MIQSQAEESNKHEQQQTNSTKLAQSENGNNQSKKHRVLIFGDGGEALITTYILSKDQHIKNSNTEIYLIYGEKTQLPHRELQSTMEEQVKGVKKIGRTKFALKFLIDSNRSLMREKIFFKYMYTKVFKSKLRPSNQYSELKPEGSHNIEMKRIANIQSLSFDGHEAVYYLKNQCDNISYVHGDVPFLHGFGDKIGHCEVDSPQLKSLRADFFVMCSSTYNIQIFRYIRHIIPIIRTSSELVAQSLGLNHEQLHDFVYFSSKYSFSVPDSRPLIGQSMKYRNLIVNFGTQDYKLETYIKNAELVRDELSLLSDALISERKSTAPQTPMAISRRDVINERKQPQPRQTVYSQILDKQISKLFKPVLDEKRSNNCVPQQIPRKVFNNAKNKSTYNLIQNVEHKSRQQRQDKFDPISTMKINTTRDAKLSYKNSGVESLTPIKSSREGIHTFRTSIRNSTTFDKEDNKSPYRKSIISGVSKKLQFEETQYLKTPNRERQQYETVKPQGIRTKSQHRTDPILQQQNDLNMTFNNDNQQNDMIFSQITTRLVSPVRDVSNEQRQLRILGYSNSSLMSQAIHSYQDNDMTHGIVNIKSITKGSISQMRLADYNDCRQNKWTAIPSPMKATKGKQTYYLD